MDAERFLDTTLDEFIAMVSHELRSPLTPILGCVHLLRTADLSQANFDRALDMIERNAKAQMQTVDDLLDASRIAAGKLQLNMKSTALVPVIEAAIETVRTAAEAKGVHIVTHLEDVQQAIDGDSHRLQQIIGNLLSNAVKFTPSEGRVEISLRPDGQYAQIQVTDTGTGILPGLGLTLVRHLVELHHGSIQAASAGPGCGTVFTLRFPLLARKAASAT